jgi:putative transposase
MTEKTEIVARSFVRVNPHNTSQICSDCNNLAEERLKLSDRIFGCKYCELKLDRDINSARNILRRAEFGFDKSPPLQSGKYL